MKRALFALITVVAGLAFASPAWASNFEGILTLSIKQKYFCTAFEVQEGIALTAAHCIVGKSPEILLTAPGGIQRTATVKAKDDQYDVAILSYEGSFGGNHVLKPILSGAPIAVLFQQANSPFAYAEVKGTVQATFTNAILLTARRTEHQYFSGSPVINDQGDVVGVVIVGAAKDNDLGLEEGQIVATSSAKILQLFPDILAPTDTKVAAK